MLLSLEPDSLLLWTTFAVDRLRGQPEYATTPDLDVIPDLLLLGHWGSSSGHTTVMPQIPRRPAGIGEGLLQQTGSGRLTARRKYRI
jgi:hypothetical protein